MNEMMSSTKRVFPFSLKYLYEDYNFALGKDVQLTTSNAFYSIVKVVKVMDGLMTVMYTKIKRNTPVVVTDFIPLHQIRSCRMYQ